jgi:hypothetical protein
MQQRITATPVHLLPLHLPPKLVLLPLKALMFKENFADGASPLEKESSVADADATFTGCEGSLFKVILYFYNMTKYIILYCFFIKLIKTNLG